MYVRWASGCQPGTDRNTNPKAAARPISRVTARLPAHRHTDSTDDIWLHATTSRGRTQEVTACTPLNSTSGIVMAKFACYSKENTGNFFLMLLNVMNKKLYFVLLRRWRARTRIWSFSVGKVLYLVEYKTIAENKRKNSDTEHIESFKL